MSETATTPIPTPPATPPAQVETPPPAAPAQDATDWKAEARKWETRAKENREALDARQKEIEDSQKSAEQKAAEATADASSARLEALRYKVAAEKGLTLALAARLSGSTKEELEADAETLMALIPKAPDAPPALPVGPTVPGQQPGGANPAAQITRSDLDALAAAGKTDEINRLRREGRLSHLLG